MPKLRSGKQTKPSKPKPKPVKKEKTLNEIITKAEIQAVEKKQTKFKHKDIFGK
tara:strand:+ start:423 stop:584 length:162 start_codon:yes stop_codon:yes gene_type:complete